MEHASGTGVVVASLDPNSIEALACNQAGQLIDMGLGRDIAKREYWDTKRSLLALVKSYGRIKVSMDLKTAEFVLLAPNVPKFGLDGDPEDEVEREVQDSRYGVGDKSAPFKYINTRTQNGRYKRETSVTRLNTNTNTHTHSNAYTEYTKGRLLSKAGYKERKPRVRKVKELNNKGGNNGNKD